MQSYRLWGTKITFSKKLIGITACIIVRTVSLGVILLVYQQCDLKAASSPLANPWVKAGSFPHKKPQLRCWRRPLMVRQPYSVAVWAPFLSPTRGTEGVVKTIERAVGTSPVPWGERLCKWAQWKFAFILPSAANLLHEKKRLGKSGGPSLKV